MVKERIQNYCKEEEPAQIHFAPEAYFAPASHKKDSYMQPATVEKDNMQLRSPEEYAAPVVFCASPMLVEPIEASFPTVLPMT
jgi:hypothetical protein